MRSSRFLIRLFLVAIVLLAMFLSSPLFSVNYIQTRYSYTDGLCQNQVNTIVEGKLGNLWIGTQYGLSCFNGYEFKNYYKAHGLGSAIIYDIEIDSQGNLWIGTANGLSKWDTNDFKTYNLKSEQLVVIRDVYISENDEIYFITGDNFGKLEDNYLHLMPMEFGQRQTRFRSICGNSKGTIFIGTEDNGLIVFSNDSIDIVPIAESSPPISSMAWDSISESLYLGTDRGLYRYVNGKIKFVESTRELEGNSITSIQINKDGTILL